MTEQMLLPDEEAIIAGLGERGLPVWGAAVVASQILSLRSPFREAFLSWWQTGNVSDVSAHGHSAQSLINSGQHPVAALLSLDALERNPVKAQTHLLWEREEFVPVVFDAMPTSTPKENQ